jgi:hypothetical protein
MSGADLGILEAEPISFVDGQPTASIDKECNIWKPATSKSLGPGGAPNRVSILPDDPAERKKYPIATGVLDYFPDALAEISRVSYTGNEQHNPGQSLRWDRSKSKDEADTMIRHFMARGSRDSDGQRHTAKAAWRLLALLQKEIEEGK